MSLKFNQVVKHGKFEFLPGVAVDFEDPDAEFYFVDKMKWADKSEDAAVRVYSQDEVSIDPNTVDGSSGIPIFEGGTSQKPGILTPNT